METAMLAGGRQQALPETEAAVGEMVERISAALRQRLSYKVMQSKFAQQYDETFAEEEVDQIAAFYWTPAGQALLLKMPVLMSKGAAIGMKQMQDFGPEFQRILNEVVEKHKTSARKP